MIVLKLEAATDERGDWKTHVLEALDVLEDLDAPVQVVTVRDHGEAEDVVETVEEVGSPIVDVSLRHPAELDQAPTLYLANVLDGNRADVYAGWGDQDELAARVADVAYVEIPIEDSDGEDLAVELAGHYAPEGAF